MATVRAEWRRTVSIKRYETETLSLSVEKDAPEKLSAGELVELSVNLDRMLAKAGDELVVERLAARVAASEAPIRLEPGKLASMTKPAEPDPFV